MFPQTTTTLNKSVCLTKPRSHNSNSLYYAFKKEQEKEKDLIKFLCDLNENLSTYSGLRSVDKVLWVIMWKLREGTAVTDSGKKFHLANLRKIIEVGFLC